jgi:hypothetical protein
MSSDWHFGNPATLPAASSDRERRKLRALIDQATGDSHDESDEHTGLLGMIREEVICPFAVRMDGEDLECIGFRWPSNGYGLNAVCRSNEKTVTVDISRLEWIEPRPPGSEWIEAYLAWRELLH